MPILPAHIEHTIQAITELHRQHHRRATPSELAVAHLTTVVARPRFVGALTGFLVLWLALNLLLPLFGRTAFDPPPFNYAEALASVAGVYVTLIILITQRRENQLAEARDQLTLQLAILNEQKSTKIIALLEELRRDMPTVPDRRDKEAEQFAQPSDPQAMADALRETTEEVSGAGPAANPGSPQAKPQPKAAR